MPQIMPIKELRNTNDISDLCHARREPIFITKNGYGDLVLMSIETYENITENARIDSAIADYEQHMVNEEELLDVKDVLASARRKHLG
ncbi:MAG: type II toxin-antitoxin system Phd/YefM family antitoxin [Lachnospiraceae bacterium]|nr:type II toxin-antitoxin system Phd/YefM family antitoxin [Lachnospiraceae bacterium]